MNILLTGASRGVGLEICKVLLEKGNTVYAISRSHTSELAELEIAYKGRLFFKSIDLANTEMI